ncbi:hypothetical protein [Marinibacterium profundimaris]|uniref:Uncharacterized protein n=1 Tax=Marinibacterium profundimaris TaxID=1679460 RepID=A0A225NW67_9RHOB|nr:hypothetical protein [Marinibacterium profundimaris]OWU77617.1 hypothetical protein ATO3_02745 [Marinibacterium profundimaris]
MPKNASTRIRRHAYDLGGRLLSAHAAAKPEAALIAILGWQPMDLDETEAGFCMSLYGIETGRHASRTGAILAWARLATEDEDTTRRRALIRATPGFRSTAAAA